MKEDTIKRAMRGNRTALAQLCQNRAKSILFRVKRYLPGSLDAEDVSQMVLIRVCERIHNLRDAGAFDAWLNTIILNEARRHMKNEAKNSNILYFDDYLEEHPESALEENRELLPLEHLFTTEDSRMILEIVDSLPDRQREAVVLHYYQDITITETAEMMGITRQGASNYLRLAREKIKHEYLERSGQAEPTEKQRSVALGALVAVPVDSLLTEAFALGEAQLGAAQEVWVKPALAQATARVWSRRLHSMTAAIVALVLVAAVSGVVVFTGALSNGTAPLAQQPERQIVFSGGSTTQENINPQAATVEEGNSGSELTVLNWHITEEGSSVVLQSGEGRVVEEPFSLLPNGTYLLTFLLVDEAGQEYTSYSNFQIRYQTEDRERRIR